MTQCLFSEENQVILSTRQRDIQKTFLLRQLAILTEPAQHLVDRMPEISIEVGRIPDLEAHITDSSGISGETLCNKSISSNIGELAAEFGKNHCPELESFRPVDGKDSHSIFAGPENLSLGLVRLTSGESFQEADHLAEMDPALSLETSHQSNQLSHVVPGLPTPS